jgi:hypothetical protein
MKSNANYPISQRSRSIMVSPYNNIPAYIIEIHELQSVHNAINDESIGEEIEENNAKISIIPNKPGNRKPQHNYSKRENAISGK